MDGSQVQRFVPSMLRDAAVAEPRVDAPELSPVAMTSIELFVGCGGLALGLARANFGHTLMVEWDDDAVATVLHNKMRGLSHIAHWPIVRRDVRDIDWREHRGRVELLSGGPPCQPFGIGGKKKGHKDARDMWPEAIRAVRDTAPAAFLFENVRNLAGPRFTGYLTWIIHYLQRPSDLPRPCETYGAHLDRLQLSREPAEYDVSYQLANAADYGAPQIRHRVLILGTKALIGAPIPPIRPTHSRDRLLWDQYVTREYWKRHAIHRPPPSPADRQDFVRVEKLRGLRAPPSGRPWVTLRDALVGLGEPNGRNNHVFQVGARAYKGHTGSALDMPAKALKAGDHGVPGGENMMVRDDGSVRYFTLREAARLVGLPDDYLFPRSWTESMRQLGNAVPAQLGEAVGNWLAKGLRAGGFVRGVS